MADSLPTPAEAKEAARRGVSVYRLRLDRGAKPVRENRAPKVPIIQTYRAPLGTGERHGNTLCCVLHTVARSKKNNTRTIFRKGRDGRTRKYVVPSLAYEAYRAEVETAIMGLRGKCELPLPAIPLSLSVVFFVPDDKADLDNLVVGLNDALESAGVFPNDRDIRHVKASAVIDADNPRIAFTLAPLRE